MEIGLGVLRWPPGEFWAATLPEFLAAVDGYIEAHGGKPKFEPLSDAERDKLAEMDKRIPDVAPEKRAEILRRIREQALEKMRREGRT